MRQLSIAALIVASLAGTAVSAAPPEVFLLIHPKCTLDKDDAEKQVTPGRGTKPQQREIHYPISTATPTVLVGDNVKDVKRTGSCFIVELRPSKVTPVKRAIVGTLVGETGRRQFPYTDVYVDQP
jgi:hypothetical protein